ncbi:MAG TPA: hypothetical protein VMW71_08680 [Thermoplasmata archaeon]|nr:hypothetical protein [Thermoplasmata archaeon]
MAKWTKIAAALLAAAAIILLSYSLFFAQEPTADDTTAPGMGDKHVYTSTNLAIMVASSFLIAIAVMFILLREEYVPLPPSMRPLPPPPPAEGAADPGTAIEPEVVVPKDPEVAVDKAAETSPDEVKRETYIILRLLTGDERIMFKAVMDAGGAALQKDLIKSTKMSNAKVSRVLDRLQEKGVITKERHGSTNRVKISVEDV